MPDTFAPCLTVHVCLAIRCLQVTLPLSSQGGGVHTLLGSCQVTLFPFSPASQTCRVPMACVCQVPAWRDFQCMVWPPDRPLAQSHSSPSLGEYVHPKEGASCHRLGALLLLEAWAQESLADDGPVFCTDALRLFQAPLLWIVPGLGVEEWEEVPGHALYRKRECQCLVQGHPARTYGNHLETKRFSPTQSPTPRLPSLASHQSPGWQEQQLGGCGSFLS